MALNLKTIASTHLFDSNETLLRVSKDGRILVTFDRTNLFLGIYEILSNKILKKQVDISNCSEYVISHLKEMPFYE